jgi:hypothetical protein
MGTNLPAEEGFRDYLSMDKRTGGKLYFIAITLI